jgi:hypothetical protein
MTLATCSEPTMYKKASMKMSESILILGNLNLEPHEGRVWAFVRQDPVYWQGDAAKTLCESSLTLCCSRPKETDFCPSNLIGKSAPTSFRCKKPDLLFWPYISRNSTPIGAYTVQPTTCDELRLP